MAPHKNEDQSIHKSYNCATSLSAITFDEKIEKQRKPHQLIFPINAHRQYGSERPYESDHELVAKPNVGLHITCTEGKHETKYELLKTKTFHIQLSVLRHYSLYMIKAIFQTHTILSIFLLTGKIVIDWGVNHRN